jgi:Type VI secretion system/phage-baseplate injector OB domain
MNMSFNTERSEECPKKYFGRYRATVINNVDPMRMGRVQVIVPDVSNVIPSTWAMPSSPVGGLQTGMYAVPTIGAGVWIEFEQGDPDYPVISGSFWGSAAEIPAAAQAAPPITPPIVIQSQSQNRIVISATPGDGIRLETALGPAGPSIIINPTAGIVLSDGKGAMISLVGGVVTINQGALVIK